MRSRHWLPGVKVGSRSGGLGKACLVLHGSWAQRSFSNSVYMTTYWIESEDTILQEMKGKIWHRRKKKYIDQPCLGRNAEAGSTCVYEHGEWWLTHVCRRQKCVYFSLQSSLCIFEVWEFMNPSRGEDEERRGGGQERGAGGKRRGSCLQCHILKTIAFSITKELSTVV